MALTANNPLIRYLIRLLQICSRINWTCTDHFHESGASKIIGCNASSYSYETQFTAKSTKDLFLTQYKCRPSKLPDFDLAGHAFYKMNS